MAKKANVEVVLLCENAEYVALQAADEIIIRTNGPDGAGDEVARVDMLDPGRQLSLAAFTQHALAVARARVDAVAGDVAEGGDA